MFGTLRERLDAKTTPTESGCWLFTGCITRSGYGHIGSGGRNGKVRRAHRVAWELANEQPVPAGYHVLHTCDVRNCVNPDHLFLGTHDDNMADKVRKGRQWRKLSDEQVGEIRRLAESGVSNQRLADAFGVGRRYVWDLVAGVRRGGVAG